MLTARVLHGVVCAGQYDLDLMFSPDLRGLALRFSQVRAWLCVWLCVCRHHPLTLLFLCSLTGCCGATCLDCMHTRHPSACQLPCTHPPGSWPCFPTSTRSVLSTCARCGTCSCSTAGRYVNDGGVQHCVKLERSVTHMVCVCVVYVCAGHFPGIAGCDAQLGGHRRRRFHGGHAARVAVPTDARARCVGCCVNGRSLANSHPAALGRRPPRVGENGGIPHPGGGLGA